MNTYEFATALKVGDTFSESGYGRMIECIVIAPPTVSFEQNDWIVSWQARRVDTGEVVNYRINQRLMHYGPNIAPSQSAQYGMVYEQWLQAAYQYYICDDPIMSDLVWDGLARILAKNWDTWDHPYKHLVERRNLYSLHYLSKEHYPLHLWRPQPDLVGVFH